MALRESPAEMPDARDVLGVMGGAFSGQEAELAGGPQLVHTLQQGGDWVLPRKQGCGGRGAGLGLCRLEKTRETAEKPWPLRPGGETGEGVNPTRGADGSEGEG